MKTIDTQITTSKETYDEVEFHFVRVNTTKQMTDKEYPQLVEGKIYKFDREDEANDFLKTLNAAAGNYNAKDITNDLSQYHRGLSAIASDSGIFVGGNLDGVIFKRNYNSDKMTTPNNEIYYRSGEVWQDEYNNHLIVYRLLKKIEPKCTHEALTDTGEDLYFCPTCNNSWSYNEWTDLNKVDFLPQKP